jgi:hypothetical protein
MNVSRLSLRSGERGFIAICLLIAAGALIGPRTTYADGTETLGTSVEGSNVPWDFVTAGTGLLTQPGRIDVTVPQGTDILQVFLYWAGRGTADATIEVNGNTIAGQLIGGPTPGESLPSSTFRADITGLVEPGGNTLTVEGLDYGPGGRNDGAGVLVIFADPGLANAIVEMRDGNDFAFVNAPASRHITVEQTFDFPASLTARPATLSLVVADALPDASDLVTIKANDIPPTQIAIADQLRGGDGAQWDTLTEQITVFPLTDEISVQIQSRGDSLAWVAAILRMPAPSVPEH